MSSRRRGVERARAVPDRAARSAAGNSRPSTEAVCSTCLAVLGSRSMRAARTPCTVSGTGEPRPRPWSPTARASSSRKNGLPSALVEDQLARAGRPGRPSGQERRARRAEALVAPPAAPARSGSRTSDRSRAAGSRAGSSSTSSTRARPRALGEDRQARPRRRGRSSGDPRPRGRAAGDGSLRSHICRSVSKRARGLMTSAPSASHGLVGLLEPSRRKQVARRARGSMPQRLRACARTFSASALGRVGPRRCRRPPRSQVEDRQVRDRRPVGEAAPLELGEPRSRRGRGGTRAAAATCPRRARRRSRHGLAAALRDARRRGRCRVAELALAADEAAEPAATRALERRASRAARPRSRNATTGSLRPRTSRVPTRSTRDVVLDEARRRLADQDRARLGGLLQAGRQVRACRRPRCSPSAGCRRSRRRPRSRC